MTLLHCLILTHCEFEFDNPALYEKLRCPFSAFVRFFSTSYVSLQDVPVLEVIWYVEKWEWYTLDNRLLWVFQELEKAGKISYIEMRRVEFVCKVTDHPKDLFDSVSTVDMEFEEPVLDRKPAAKAVKKGRDIKLLSKSLSRLKLCRRKAEKSRVRKENDSRNLSSSLVDICDSNAGALDVACFEKARQGEMQPVEMQRKQIQPTEMQPKPMESVEMQRKETKPGEMQSMQIQTVEMQSREMQPVEMQPKGRESLEVPHMQIKPAEVQLKEMKPVETKPKQIQPTQVQSKELGPLEMQAKEMESVEMQPKETESIETRPKKIQYLQMQSKGIQPVEMQPKEKECLETQPMQIKPMEMQPKEGECVEVGPTQIQPIQMQSKEAQSFEMQHKGMQPVKMQPEEIKPVETHTKEVQPVEMQLRQIQPTDMQPREVQHVRMQTEEMEPVEFHSKEVQPAETQPREIQPTEVQPRAMQHVKMQIEEMEPMEMQTNELQRVETQPRRILSSELQPREVEPVEKLPQELGSVETQPKHIQSLEMQSKQMILMEMQPMERKPVAMQPKQIRSVERKPMQMQRKMDKAAFVNERLDLNNNFTFDTQETFPIADMLPQCKSCTVADNEDTDAKQFREEEQCASLQVEEGRIGLFTPDDDEIEPVSDLSNFPHGSLDVFLKEDSGGYVDDKCMDDVLSICHSRSPSICSYSPDSHSIDDWDCENQETSGNCGNVDQPSDDEWIEIESIQDLAGDSSSVKNAAKDDAVDDDNVFDDSYDGTSNNAKETVQAWLNDRKKFCRNSKNSHFHEYVVDNINPTKPKKSLTQSLLSLDSAFSSTSALSSISREQRQLSVLSGLFGYGNFDKYNKEYLSKLRADRLASKRRLKPYDVTSRRQRNTRARETSPIGNQNRRDDFTQQKYSKTVICTEERVRKQTYSETVSFNERRSHEYRHVTSTVCKSSSWYFQGARMRDRGRSYSETDFKPQRSRRRPMSDSNSKRRRLSSLSSIGSSSGRCNTSLGKAFQDHTLSKESLYSLWQNRREDYMKARYMGSSSRYKSQNSLALTGYTCGICFKSFETRTRREQHSDELMHWTCITCGRFFASHTALGQHVEEMGHRKD